MVNGILTPPPSSYTERSSSGKNACKHVQKSLDDRRSLQKTPEQQQINIKREKNLWRLSLRTDAPLLSVTSLGNKQQPLPCCVPRLSRRIHIVFIIDLLQAWSPSHVECHTTWLHLVLDEDDSKRSYLLSYKHNTRAAAEGILKAFAYCVGLTQIEGTTLT